MHRLRVLPQHPRGRVTETGTVNAARPCGAVSGRWRPGPNPGVVELTIALYRGFGFPRDALVFGIGHQGYVHRPLARGQAGFGALRQPGAGRAAASGSERRAALRRFSRGSSALLLGSGDALDRHIGREGCTPSPVGVWR
ncbi:1-deoxy-D-xylulose-5-phosphate synthase N-terminal domain-containing protein [Streptomyces klenkii]